MNGSVYSYISSDLASAQIVINIIQRKFAKK